MKWQELQDKLIYLTKRNITNVELADALGISKSNITFKKQNQREVELHELIKIAEYFNVPVLSLNNQNTIEQEEREETVLMDYYPEVFGSCGTGIFELSQEKEQIRVPKRAICTTISPLKKYSVINAYGNSMCPYIQDKDKLIIEHWNNEQIIDNRIYVFVYKSSIFIKRLVKNINQLVIISDNKDYDVIKLSEKDMNNVHIIGQIVGIMRDAR